MVGFRSLPAGEYMYLENRLPPVPEQEQGISTGNCAVPSKGFEAWLCFPSCRVEFHLGTGCLEEQPISECWSDRTTLQSNWEEFPHHTTLAYVPSRACYLWAIWSKCYHLNRSGLIAIGIHTSCLDTLLLLVGLSCS